MGLLMEKDKSQVDVTNSSGDILVTVWTGIRCQECAFKHTGHLRNAHLQGACISDHPLTIPVAE